MKRIIQVSCLRKETRAYKELKVCLNCPDFIGCNTAFQALRRFKKRYGVSGSIDYYIPPKPFHISE